MSKFAAKNGNGAHPAPVPEDHELSDGQAVTAAELSDLVAQMVMDKLEEHRHRDVFLDAVIGRVNNWKDELGIEAILLPDAVAAPHVAPRNSDDQTPQYAEHPPSRRSLYYKYEDDCFSSLKTRVLVSCLDNASREGGVYELDFGANSFRQLVRCDGRGIARYGDGYIVAARDRGLFVFDGQLRVVKNHPLPYLDLHGIACGPDGLIYLVETKHNRVGIYTMEPFERVGEIVVSEDAEDRNHVNDLCFRDGKLLLSMFSAGAFWRKNLEQGVFDGVVAEYDVQEKRHVRNILTGLQMPHTLKIVGSELCYCESFALSANQSGEKIGQFFGYTRGLEFDGRFYYVGQSRIRHRRKHKALTLSSDAGVHLLDPKEQISRFVQIPTSEVYAVLVIE